MIGYPPSRRVFDASSGALELYAPSCGRLSVQERFNEYSQREAVMNLVERAMDRFGVPTVLIRGAGGRLGAAYLGETT